MANLAPKSGAGEQASIPHYFHDIKWRLLAEIPWLAFASILAVSMLIRLILVSEGTSHIDQVFKSTIPITVMMGFLLVPMIILIASGDADLSLGYLAGVVGCVVVLLSPKIGLGAAIFVSLLVALGLGLVNGLLVGLVRLKGIIVTFAMSFLLSGLILQLTGGKVIAAPKELNPALARSPLFVLLWLLLVVGFAVLMKFTPLGRRPRRGDPVKETLGTRLLYQGLPFVLSGLMAWISGIMVISWVGYATIAIGMGYAEMVLLATLLGGTAYYAGTGFFLSGAIALFAIVLFRNGNQTVNISATDQKVVEGIVLLVMLPITHLYHVYVEKLYHRFRKE
jgi:ribose transport system permease protein